MTNTGKPFSIPTRLIVLDIMGTLLAAIGLLELTAGLELLPIAFRFDGYGLALIVSGGILMLPLIANIVAQVINRAKA